jgi:hypothetical protein
MLMREAKSVQRTPEAKLLGASRDFAEPHGHDGRQHRRRAAEPNHQLPKPPRGFRKTTD